jgi:peptidoglycan/LPS O-acetylase OafA/YrhL
MRREGGDIDRTIVVRIVGKLQVMLSLRYEHLFAIGIVLYHRSDRRAQPADWLLLAGCWILHGIVDSWPAALLIAALTFVLHGAAIGRLGALAARPLVLLGSISYPLYLIHQNVGYVAIRELELRRLSPTVAIASSLAVVLALAWGLSFAVERPAQNWIKRRRQSRRAPKPPLGPPERVISIRGRAAYVRLTGHYLSD